MYTSPTPTPHPGWLLLCAAQTYRLIRLEVLGTFAHSHFALVFPPQCRAHGMCGVEGAGSAGNGTLGPEKGWNSSWNLFGNFLNNWELISFLMFPSKYVDLLLARSWPSWLSGGIYTTVALVAHVFYCLDNVVCTPSLLELEFLVVKTGSKCCML